MSPVWSLGHTFATGQGCPAHRQAQEILERESVIRLNREQTKRVFELLDCPPKPNPELLSAKAAHQKFVRA